MSGGGSIDSFNSSLVPGNHQWSLPYRRNHGDVGVANNTTNSDLRSTYVYGNLAYGGAVVKNTPNVQGQTSTPGHSAVGATKDPTTSTWWQSDNFQTSQPYFQSGN